MHYRGGRRAVKCFGVIVLLAVACALVGLGGLYLGIYDVAATKPHSKLVVWTAGVLVDRSVERRAGEGGPVNLSDPSLLTEGAEHYKAMSARNVESGLRR
jgi:hypothetical protein